MEEELCITTLEERDLNDLMGELVLVYQHAYATLPEYGYHSLQRIEGYIRWLWRGDPQGFFVAFLGKRLAGFVGAHAVWWENGELFGEIHEFVVDPAFQGRGVGSALFGRALEYLTNRGRRKIGLWVGEKNEGAMQFYLKRGFHKITQYGKWVRMVKEVEVPVSPRDFGEAPLFRWNKR